MRKEIQKKEKGGRRCRSDTPPFRPAQPRGPAPPRLPTRADAPASLHPAPATWRPYEGDVAAAARPTGITWSRPIPSPLPLLLHSRAAAAAAVLRLAPLAAQPSSPSRPPYPIKPAPSSASTSSTPCAHSRPSASRYWARPLHHAMAGAPASSRSA